MKDSSDGSCERVEEAEAPQVELIRAKRPWWLPHFLGRVPLGLDSRYVSLVGVVALAGLFENYDLSVLSAALKQIRESFGLDQSEMTSMLAWVRLGAIPAFLILPLAIYSGPGAGIPFSWIPFVFILTGSNVLMRIISSELFPMTSSRNTALGWETLCETLGGAIGFALVGSFTAASASIAPAVVAVSALTVFGVIVVWVLPESAGLELEATSQVSSVDAQG